MPRRSLSGELESLASLREPTRRALYEFVQQSSTAVGRDEAAEALGIGRALAAFHLDRLVEAGFLRAGYRRLSGRSGPGAGRPSKLYRRSRRRIDISLPHREFELLAGILAASPPNGPDGAPPEPAHEVGRSLGVRARHRLRRAPPATRLAECVEAVLEDLGFEPYPGSHDEVRLRNCPFDPLSRRYAPVVCRAGVALVGGVVDGVGASHLRVTRDERPDLCCVVLTSTHGASADGAAPDASRRPRHAVRPPPAG
jgi:predicted ArsR family transcriptional regulator